MLGRIMGTDRFLPPFLPSFFLSLLPSSLPSFLILYPFPSVPFPSLLFLSKSSWLRMTTGLCRA